MRLITCFLVDFWIKPFVVVGFGNQDGFQRLGALTRDSFPKRDANFASLEIFRNLGVECIALFIHREKTDAIGLHHFLNLGHDVVEQHIEIALRAQLFANLQQRLEFLIARLQLRQLRCRVCRIVCVHGLIPPLQALLCLEQRDGFWNRGNPLKGTHATV